MRQDGCSQPAKCHAMGVPSAKTAHCSPSRRLARATPHKWCPSKRQHRRDCSLLAVVGTPLLAAFARQLQAWPKGIEVSLELQCTPSYVDLCVPIAQSGLWAVNSSFATPHCGPSTAAHLYGGGGEKCVAVQVSPPNLHAQQHTTLHDEEAESLSLSETVAAGTSGLQEATQEAVEEVAAAAQAAAEKAAFLAKRLQRQQSRARCAFLGRVRQAAVCGVAEV